MIVLSLKSPSDLDDEPIPIMHTGFAGEIAVLLSSGLVGLLRCIMLQTP
jgi:hypothetical protein